MAASKQAVTAIARQSLSARELFVGTMNTICRIVNMEVVSYQVADQLTQTILAICNKTMIASTATLPPPRLMVYLFLLLIIIVNYGVWGKWGVNFSLVYLNMYAIFTFFLGIPLAQQILFQCYAPFSAVAQNSKRAHGDNDDDVDEDQETPVERQEETRREEQVAHKKHAAAANMFPLVQKIVPGRPKETRCALFIYRT